MSYSSRLLSYIIAFGMLIPSGFAYAKLTPVKLAHQELISLREYARSIKNDLKESDNLLIDSYMNPAFYRNAKAILSLDQQTRLITCAQIFDKALINKHLDPKSTQVDVFFKGLEDEIEAIRAESFSVGKSVVRKHPKHSWVKIEKETQKNNPNTYKSISDLNNDLTDEDTRALQEMFGKDFDPKKLENAFNQLQNPSTGGILNLIKNNKKWIGMALATAYALLAKANDWPPYGPDLDDVQDDEKDIETDISGVQISKQVAQQAVLENSCEPQSTPEDEPSKKENVPTEHGWNDWVDMLVGG